MSPGRSGSSRLGWSILLLSGVEKGKQFVRVAGNKKDHNYTRTSGPSVLTICASSPSTSIKGQWSASSSSQVSLATFLQSFLDVCSKRWCTEPGRDVLHASSGSEANGDPTAFEFVQCTWMYLDRRQTINGTKYILLCVVPDTT